MKNTTKSLLASVLSLLLCVSMFVGSTFAWFTDTAVSANNKIVSGTLKIDLELLTEDGWESIKEDKTPIFDYDKWEPGYTDVKILKVENEGNLALKWYAKFVSANDITEIADVIDVYVLPSATEISAPTDRNLAGYTKVGTVAEFINSIEDTTYGTLKAGEVAYLGIALKMQETAGNEYQDITLGAFDIRIYATQHTSESDSFDNLYDLLADESIVAADSKTLEEGSSSIDYGLGANGVTIANVSVPADAILDPSQPVTVVFDGIDPKKTIEVGENTKAYAFDISITNLKSNLAADQLITVVVAAPKGLPGLKAYHNGVLIPDAVYDEVAGTITFEASSFSPFAFTYTEIEVDSLAAIRDAATTNEVLLKLTADIDIIDLSKGSADRSEAHKTAGAYYNAVNIENQNVAIDLNGHNITVYCGDKYNSNSDVGALFYIGPNGSLNIIDQAGGGYIKMASSIYAVWAPYADPSYVDIFSGIFIADSYAGDIIGTAYDANGNPDPVNGTMKNENTNRALIYAGFGGNIHVRGGYFLYNNTPNDTLDRNNGAFNAKDHYQDGPLLTIHPGVMLINQEYRQNPANTSTPHGTFDNNSVVLAEENGRPCTIQQVTLDTPMMIGNNSYSVWYKVTSPYKYKITYMNGQKVEGTDYVDNNNVPFKLREVENGMQWIDREGQPITSIPEGNTSDVVVYKDAVDVYNAYFVDKDGNVIATVQFQKGQTSIDEPEVPHIDGYIGKWENYTLTDASIVIKPYYTQDSNAEELFKLDITELFNWIGAGKTVIMTQELNGGQSNSSTSACCTVTGSNALDNNATLDLNGYTLGFKFSANGNKQWHIFEILNGSSLYLTGGMNGGGTLLMDLTVLNKNAKAYVISLASGAKLELEKGVTIEFKYPTNAAGRVSMFANMSQEELLAQYPTLQFTNENGVMRLVALETTTIVGR